MDMMTIINVFKQGAMNLSVPKLILGQSRTKIQSKKNKDKELSELLNYIYARFGNGEYEFTPEEIAVFRELHSNHSSN